MKVLTDGAIKAIVDAWYETTPLYEALVLMGAQAQHIDTLRQVKEWGIEQCQKHYKGGGVISRRECPLCWKEL